MRHILALIAVLWLAPSSHANELFQELFNGRDLQDWDGDPTIWRVENGLLTGTTTATKPLSENSFVIWKGGEVEDFELKVVFRLEGKNNSGVQYRSQRIPGRAWGVAGYQADLHPEANYLGMLYDEEGRKILAESSTRVRLARDGSREIKRLPEPTDHTNLNNWQELVIKAVGNHLVHTLNGQVVVDVLDQDAAHSDTKGLVALQVHTGEPMKVQFKSISLRRIEPPVEKDDGDEKLNFSEIATSPEKIKVASGFKVELLYTVPRGRLGSWVNLCIDPKGRLLTSDEYGDLYRITVSRDGANAPISVERIPVDLGSAHGLLYAFDSLYVVVNGDPSKRDNGLYRVRDTNGDDHFDSVELLRKLDGLDDHGPHAVVLGPDRNSLYVVCGNKTKLTDFKRSRVPRLWDEDQLLPRLYGVGYMREFPAPGGCIYRTGPDGKDWELVSTGYRNIFDAAFNSDGELFTYDSDMEFDIGTPWYRPTRVCHVVSGSDWGWRNGSAKWPVHYAETLPPVVNIGPGSPTGVSFGYGARFPEKYQRALFLCDWTYGKIYSLHLEPNGSSYKGALEEFVIATPLPLTDTIINPTDGAMYFITGGRGVQTGLYRITYTGGESTSPAELKRNQSVERDLRHQLEALHIKPTATSIDHAWKHLGSSDRFIRHAARTVLEQTQPSQWQHRALDETDPRKSLSAIVALVRTVPRSFKHSNLELDTPPPKYPTADAERHPLQLLVLKSLARFNLEELSQEQTLEILRAYALAFYRLGPPAEEMRSEVSARLEQMIPTNHRDADAMLIELLCYLQAPGAADHGVRLLSQARTQEEQLAYARSLRFLREHWTEDTRREFLSWIRKAQLLKGGVNFQKFIEEIKVDFLAGLSDAERVTHKDVIESLDAVQPSTVSIAPRPFVREWTSENLLPLVEEELKGRNFERGREMFAAANCFACHRFVEEGGAVGPDLTALSGRFSARDILESILDPDKVISDQYAAVTVTTSEGKVITGRVVNYNDGEMFINTNMLDPVAIEKCNQASIEEMTKSDISMMPKGLLNTLTQEEILDLMAYLLSRGDQNHEAFTKPDGEDYSSSSPAN